MSAFAAATLLTGCRRRRYRQRVSAEDVGVVVPGPANLEVVVTLLKLTLASLDYLRVFYPECSNQHYCVNTVPTHNSFFIMCNVHSLIYKHTRITERLPAISAK